MTSIHSEENSRETDTSKVAKLFKILSVPHRVEIIRLLEEKEQNVSSLTHHLQMEQSAVSHQLKILKEARLIRSKRVGKTIVYQLDDDHVYKIIQQVFHHIEEEYTKRDDRK